MTPGAPTLQVPRWIQLVMLPLILLGGWIVASAVRHVLFVFLVSAIIALLLNPLVHALTTLRLPRGLAVVVVYLSFATIVIGGAVALGSVVVDQVESVAKAVKHDFTVQDKHKQTEADRRIESFQRWLDGHGLSRIHIRRIGQNAVTNVREHGLSSYTKRALDLGQTVATEIVTGLFNTVLIIVISIYMLLDAPRLSRFTNRLFPPGPDGKELGKQVQLSLAAYTRGQLLVSLIIGVSSGVGMEVLGLLGVWPDARRYAIFFGAFAMVTEVIPYVGPVIGALPPIFLALLHQPLTAVWVAIVYLVIHQLEGHVVVPRVMGQALGAHPLIVIFALLAGAELYGFFGAILALPVVAMTREIAAFLRIRIRFEPWPAGGLVGAGTGAGIAVPVEMAHESSAAPPPDGPAISNGPGGARPQPSPTGPPAGR